MNDRPMTDDRIAAALGGYLPATAQPGLRDRIHGVVTVTTQQKRMPWPLGALVEADVAARRRNLLVGTAFLLALALSVSAVVGALLLRHRDDTLPARRGPLAFVQHGDLYLANEDGTGAVAVAHVDGSPLSRPHWSPDGRWIAVETDEPAVLALDTRTLKLRRLAVGRIGDWSPDGNRLAVVPSRARYLDRRHDVW